MIRAVRRGAWICAGSACLAMTILGSGCDRGPVASNPPPAEDESPASVEGPAKSTFVPPAGPPLPTKRPDAPVGDWNAGACTELVPAQGASDTPHCPPLFGGAVDVWFSVRSGESVAAGRTRLLRALGNPKTRGSPRGADKPVVTVIATASILQKLEKHPDVSRLDSREPVTTQRGMLEELVIGRPAIEWRWTRRDGFTAKDGSPGPSRKEILTYYRTRGANLLTRECVTHHRRSNAMRACVDQAQQRPRMAESPNRELVQRLCSRVSTQVAEMKGGPDVSAKTVGGLLRKEMNAAKVEACVATKSPPEDFLWLRCRYDHGMDWVGALVCVELQREFAEIADPIAVPADGLRSINAFYRYAGDDEPVLRLLARYHLPRYYITAERLTGEAMYCMGGECARHAAHGQRIPDTLELVWPRTAEECVGSEAMIESCRVALALQKEDPAACQDPTVAGDECYSEYALQRGDPGLCDQVEDDARARRCRAELAIVVGDPSLCAQITERYHDGRPRADHCYTDYARSRNDSSVCEHVEARNMIRQCRKADAALGPPKRGRLGPRWGRQDPAR